LLTEEEEHAYQDKRASINAKAKIWRDSKLVDKKVRPLSIDKIRELEKLGLPVSAEDTARLTAYRERKNRETKEQRDRRKNIEEAYAV